MDLGFIQLASSKIVNYTGVQLGCFKEWLRIPFFVGKVMLNKFVRSGMENCIFCQIIQGKKSGDIVYQDEQVTAFRDINPQAPVHLLIVPNQHIPTVNDLKDEDASLIGKLYLIAKKLATQEGIHNRGYRLVMNCNLEAGQSVYHIHLHLLGGRWMKWPPG